MLPPKKTNNAKISKIRALPWIILGVAIILAIVLRLVIPWGLTFPNDQWIRFGDVDCYYHMRVVDNLVVNFPNLSQYDPYRTFPYQSIMADRPLFDYMIAGTALLLGGGEPSQRLVDLVGAYISPFLFIFVILLVFFITKILFKNDWVAGLSALIVGTLGGEIFGRSMLGAADHHTLELLLSLLVIFLFVLTLKFGMKDLKGWLVGICTGIAFGFYYIAWAGALIIYMIVVAFGVVYIIYNHFKGIDSKDVMLCCAVPMIASLPIILPVGSYSVYKILMVGVSLIPVMVWALSKVMYRQKWSFALVLISVVVGFFAVYGLLRWYIGTTGLNSEYDTQYWFISMHNYMQDIIKFLAQNTRIDRLFVWDWPTVTEEELPFLIVQGHLSFARVWSYFGISFFIAISMLVILLINTLKNGDKAKWFVVIWSLAMMMATLTMVRFAYYFAINVAILTGWFCYEVYQLASPKLVNVKNYSGRFIIVGVVVVGIMLPNFSSLQNIGKGNIATMQSGWHEAMLWLRENGEKPFDDIDYDSLYNVYTEPNHTTMVWWDYGYWVLREGKQVPLANPGESIRNQVAQCFLSDNKTAIAEFMELYKVKYVIADYEITAHKFYAVPLLAKNGKSALDYYEPFKVLKKQPDNYELRMIFYPEYYKTLLNWLYYFNGEIVPLEKMPIFTAKNNELLSVTVFETEKEAQNYIRGSGGFLASNNPNISPIELNSLGTFKKVFESRQKAYATKTPLVKIFEYIEPDYSGCNCGG